jgi:hypothetical protein
MVPKAMLVRCAINARFFAACDRLIAQAATPEDAAYWEKSKAIAKRIGGPSRKMFTHLQQKASFTCRCGKPATRVEKLVGRCEEHRSECMAQNAWRQAEANKGQVEIAKSLRRADRTCVSRESLRRCAKGR